MSTSPALPGQVELLEHHLLVQASADDADHALKLADGPGAGMILTGKRSLDTALRLRKAGNAVPLLVDRRRYAGKKRVSGTAAFDAQWLDAQRGIAASCILSDSGYIGSGDTDALRKVLVQTVAAGPDVTAVLPLHADWLGRDLATLLTEITAFDVPVAIVIEHRNDPLSVLETTRGLVRLLHTAPSVAVLSSDVSALGALAFGARWAAVGVRTSLRHLYPVTSSGFGPKIAVHSALVDPALAFIKVDKIAAAWAATQDDPAWVCPCSVCHGRSLDWLMFASQYEANEHTFELLRDRRDRLMRVQAGVLREQSWRVQCAHAAFQYESLALAGVRWDVPRFLRNWQSV